MLLSQSLEGGNHLSTAVLQDEEEEKEKDKEAEGKLLVNLLEDTEPVLNLSHWCQPAD